MNFRGWKTARIAALCCGLLAGGSAGAVVIDIDNGELAKLVASGVPLIDIRTSPEWQQTGVVPGSHLLTFFDEQVQLRPAGIAIRDFRKVRGRILIYRHRPLTEAVYFIRERLLYYCNYIRIH